MTANSISSSREPVTGSFKNPRDNNERYLTRKELAAILGISTRTLARWHQLRVGPPRIAVGHVILYRRTSVDRWLLDQEVYPVSQQASEFRRGRP